MSTEAAKLLKSYFDAKKAKKSGYSLRALARDAGFAPSYLSAIFNGKKPIPFSRLDGLCSLLDMDQSAIAELKQRCLPAELQNHSSQNRLGNWRFDDKWAIADKSSCSLLRQWFYPAILDLTTCRDFDGSVSDIARRLKLHPDTAAIAVRDLLSSGLLTLKDGRLRKSSEKIRFASARSQAEIRRYHSQMLDRAKVELESKTSDADFGERLITGLSIASSPEKIATARQMLSNCLHEIAEYLSEGDCTVVYHLSAQLFPMTSTSSEPVPSEAKPSLFTKQRTNSK